jgi:hypothetical protein
VWYRFVLSIRYTNCHKCVPSEWTRGDPRLLFMPSRRICRGGFQTRPGLRKFFQHTPEKSIRAGSKPARVDTEISCVCIFHAAGRVWNPPLRIFLSALTAIVAARRMSYYKNLAAGDEGLNMCRVLVGATPSLCHKWQRASTGGCLYI